MSDWTLTLGLQTLREQVNEAFPDRDKASDGTIGDAAHQAETSGHNPDDTAGSRPEWDGDGDDRAEVRAWDMDSDLRFPGVSTQDLVDHLRQLPGLGSVIRYMIYNRRMYHVDDDFAPRAYSGPSPHTEHVHFSGARSQAADGNTTFDYHLEDLVMPTVEEIAAGVVAKFRNTKEVLSDTEHAAMVNDTAKAAAALVLPAINQILALARNEATEVPPTIDEIRAAVVSAVGSLPTPAEKAQLLAAVLGPDAAAVGRILAGV